MYTIIQKAFSSNLEEVTMIGYARYIEEFQKVIKYFAYEFCEAYELIDNIESITKDGIYLLVNDSRIKLIKRSTSTIPGYLYNSTTIDDKVLYEWYIIKLDTESLQKNIRNSKRK
jgi:hypothetical protein